MGDFGIGDVVTLLSDEVKLYVVGWDRSIPNTINCFWLDNQNSAQIGSLPCSILTGESQKLRKHGKVVRPKEPPSLLTGDVVRLIGSEVKMTVATTSNERPFMTTCYWMNDDKKIQSAELPSTCLEIVR